MNGWYISALVLSILSIVICVALFVVPKRKYALILRFTFDVVTIVNSVCLYMYIGDKVLLSLVASSAVGAIRDVIFLFRDKYKWADSYWWLLLFTVSLTLFSVLGWSGWLTLLPIIGTIINTYALYLKDYKKMKIITLFGQICFITYYAFLIPEGDILMILNLIVSSAMLISAIFGLTAHYIKQKQLKNNPQNEQ